MHLVGGNMRRREFVCIASAALAWPAVAVSQQSPRMPRVVLLSPVNIPTQANALRAQLRELGNLQGRNIRLDFQDAAGHVDQLPMLAEKLVQAGDVDVILAISTPAALAAHKATQTIPIVAFTAVDPVGSGLANNLAHPGG